ncbi:hypothetical protein BGX26_005612 [Mortierella sp. AD094]|nr:hypothetical protein BGX26_005612 [Mortierella sp. AD094]
MAETQQAAPTSHLLYRSPVPSPPDSPPHPSEDVAATASSSTSSVDRLPPPPFCEVGATPAPSEEHADMISHDSEIVLEDEENLVELHAPVFIDISRPTSPSPPARSTTATTSSSPFRMTHDAAATSMDDHEIRRPDIENGALSVSGATITSFFTAPPSSSPNSHQNMSSPFSFFSNSTLFHDDHSKPHVHVKTLKIELEQSEIVLMEGRTTVLKGVLYVNLQKNTKVKSLQLEFNGRSSVTWVDDNAYSPATRHTTAPHIEHNWTLISNPGKKGSTVLLAGQHGYPFSLELPDTLPESLTTTHGKVAYRLTATLTRPGITFTSSSATALVKILRRHAVLALHPRAYHRGVRVRNAPEDKVLYNIVVPQVRVPHSAKIPLQVSITSPNSRTTVSVLQVGLWERVVYKADGRRRVDMRLVKIQKSEGWPHLNREDSSSPVEAVTWNKVLLFDMPEMGYDVNHCNPSVDNGLMKVNHIMRFSILGFDGVKRFRIESEIELKVLAFEDEYLQAEGGVNEDDPLNELPSYLTSFSTPRVSIDSERDLELVDDDLLQALVARIHLPTYAESEEDTNSRNPSRDVSRNTSRDVSRNASQAPSRCASPERSMSNDSTHGSISSSGNGSGTGGSSHSLFGSDDHTVLPLLPAILHPRPVLLNGRSRLQDSNGQATTANSVYQARTGSPLRSN